MLKSMSIQIVDAHTFIKQAEKFQQTLSARRLMTTLFWDRTGGLMEELYKGPQ
jgi:hypothetical protein